MPADTTVDDTTTTAVIPTGTAAPPAGMLLALAGTAPELMTCRPGRAREQGPDPEGTLLIGYGDSAEVAQYGARPGWAVHAPGHPDEVRRILLRSAADGERAYIHVSARSNAEPHATTTEGFEVVREGRAGVVIAVGATLDPVLRATAGFDLTVLYAVTIRPFDTIGLRTAVLAAEHPDVILVEPYPHSASAHSVAETLTHVPHRLLTLGGGPDETSIAARVRNFMR
ncbi:transketolase [Streptomyces sp. NPDC088554]|uniref:transketolase n=1 Tax=Streptomyces sp. NPDC088554 TaxID=3365865 RepID=UPI00382507C7